MNSENGKLNFDFLRRGRTCFALAVLLGIVGSWVGCGPNEGREKIFLPKDRAIEIVNTNNEVFHHDAQGSPVRVYFKGRWSGWWTESDGTVRHGDGGFWMTLVWPTRICLSADMKPVVDKLFEVGCNEDECWFWRQHEADELVIGSRDEVEQTNGAEWPIRPDAFLEAIGIQWINPDDRGWEAARYRVDPDSHQLIYEELHEGQPVIVKEYWLGRSPPNLINRVVYRQPDGQEFMNVQLSNYRPISAGGSLLARTIVVDCPLAKHHLQLELSDSDGDRPLPRFYSDVDHFMFRSPIDRPAINPQCVAPKNIIHLQDLRRSKAVD